MCVNGPGPVASDQRPLTRPIFISYATADRRDALALCKAIERRGTECWISCRNVEPGANYQEAIVRALRDAPAMVLVFSDAANNSDEIKKELSLASRYRVPVIALRIEDVEPSGAFAYEFATRQWIDAFEHWDSSVDALLQTLNRLEYKDQGARITPSSAAGRGARIGSWGRRRGIAALVALVLLATVVGLLLWRPFAASEPLTVQIGQFQALAGIPAETPIAFQQALVAAFGDDNAVAVKDKHATFALGGSIRNVGDHIQYAVELTDSHSGEMIWSATPEAPLEVGALGPRQTAERIIWIIRCGLADSMEYRGRLPNRALALYFQHCQLDHWGEGRPDRLMDVIRKVLALAPNFSKGWSALALDAAFAARDAPPDTKAKLVSTGNDAVRRAIKLDPRNAQAYLAAAELLPLTDWAGREKLHRKSVEVRDSDCGCEHEHYGSFLDNVGRPGEAVPQWSRALDMQPRSPSANFGMIMSEYQSGGATTGSRTLSDYADFWKGSRSVKRLQLWQAIWTRKWNDAAALSQDFLKEPARAVMTEAFASLASGNSIRRSQAATAVSQLPDGTDQGGEQIVVLAQLGAPPEAMALVRREMPPGQENAAFLLDSALAPLRSEPAWLAIMQRLRLIDYWHSSHKPPEFCKAADAPAFCKTL